jgi:hypothetical protein
VLPPLQVTVLDKVEEEWPVARERAHEVMLSEVTLEPRTAEVPEIAMQDVEVEVRAASLFTFLHAERVRPARITYAARRTLARRGKRSQCECC